MFSKFMNKMIFANLATFGEGKISIMGVGAVILSAPVLADLFLRFYKAIGKDAFDAFYNAGYDHGLLIGKSSVEHFGMDKEKFFSQMTDSSNMMGMGLLEVVNSNPETGAAYVKLKDSTVAKEVLRLNKKKTKFPVDWFYAGTSAGVYEAAFKKKFVCKEVKCMAMGAPCCEFEVKPR